MYPVPRFCLVIFLICLSILHASEDVPTVLVTCASGELGSEIARVLAPQHNLICTGRDKNKLQNLQKELRSQYPHTYEVCLLDYADKESLSKYAEYIQSPLAGVVLITPRPQFYGKDVLQEEKTWFEVFQKTFTGPLEALKGVLTRLSKGSKIVVIAGTTSVQYLPEAGPSCVIRRMWTTYIKGLARELGPRKISINALSPGVVLTNFHKERIQKKANETGISYNEQMEKEVAPIPLHSHVQPNNVAEAVRFLLSPQSDFINGANIVLDGGLTVSY